MRIVKSGGVFLLGLYVVFLSSWGHVGATPRGCPSHGRLQGAAPTVCKIYFIRSETK